MGCCCGSSKIDTYENEKVEYKYKGRRCTNLPCCVLFVVFWIIFIALFIYGLTGNSDLYTFYFAYNLDCGMQTITEEMCVENTIMLVQNLIIVKITIANTPIIPV